MLAQPTPCLLSHLPLPLLFYNLFMVPCVYLDHGSRCCLASHGILLSCFLSNILLGCIRELGGIYLLWTKTGEIWVIEPFVPNFTTYWQIGAHVGEPCLLLPGSMIPMIGYVSYLLHVKSYMTGLICIF